MVTLQFTIEELQALQNMLAFTHSFILLAKSFSQNNELKALDEKINGFIGDPVELSRRAEARRNLADYYADKPKIQARKLKEFDEVFPLPMGLAGQGAVH